MTHWDASSHNFPCDEDNKLFCSHVLRKSAAILRKQWPVGGNIVSMEQMLVRVQGNVQWKCFLSKEGHWIGICDPLGITLQADTWGDLMEDISLTLDAVLRDLLVSDELPKFLQEHGFVLAGKMPNPKDDVRFDMPFVPAMVNAANGLQREFHQ